MLDGETDDWGALIGLLLNAELCNMLVTQVIVGEGLPSQIAWKAGIAQALIDLLPGEPKAAVYAQYPTDYDWYPSDEVLTATLPEDVRPLSIPQSTDRAFVGLLTSITNNDLTAIVCLKSPDLLVEMTKNAYLREHHLLQRVHVYLYGSFNLRRLGDDAATAQRALAAFGSVHLFETYFALGDRTSVTYNEYPQMFDVAARYPNKPQVQQAWRIWRAFAVAWDRLVHADAATTVSGIVAANSSPEIAALPTAEERERAVLEALKGVNNPEADSLARNMKARDATASGQPQTIMADYLPVLGLLDFIGEGYGHPTKVDFSGYTHVDENGLAVILYRDIGLDRAVRKWVVATSPYFAHTNPQGETFYMPEDFYTANK